MKKISLTQGRSAIVDDIDFKYLMQWKWHYRSTGYAGRSQSKTPTSTIYMHRELLNRILGHNDFDRCDHENMNRLDNRRSNLRPASRSQNRANSKLQSGSSKFKGVSWSKADQKWRAHIKFQGKSKSIGFFDDEIDAARAYNKAAIEYFGEFARLNDV